MIRRGVLRCLGAALLFGASAPAASSLAGEMPALELAGLLYLGAAIAVIPSVVRRRPSWDSAKLEWPAVCVAVVAGGAIGPALFVAGLARTDAASASILLNLELAATVLFAVAVFREHLGVRLLVGAGLVTVGGMVLGWQPGARPSFGAVLIAAACLAWGLDNGVTARIEQLSPEHVVFLKGLVAGSANLILGVAFSGDRQIFEARQFVAALAIGAAGYGWSITLWVKGARDLGAARGQVLFATAPFVGAMLSWIVLGEAVVVVQLIAMAFAAVGVGVSLKSAHTHEHRHDPLRHDHEHSHDDAHHDHEHPGDSTDTNWHIHSHAAGRHAHPHVPDLQHRHLHD